MRLLPYSQASSVANVIVDGAATEKTVLTLSHWPKSGTPGALKADTSTEIVFNYLNAPRFHVEADAVSNNHFDEDGLVGIFAMVEQPLAERHRRLLIDVAQAGDFGVYATRHAARIAFALSACTDSETSPLSPDIFEWPYLDLANELYVQLLAILPRLLTGIDDFRSLWEDQDANLTKTEQLIDKGAISFEEHVDLDLAVVRVPEESGPPHPSRFTARRPALGCFSFRVNRVEMTYRYESWVQMASRRPALPTQ